MKDLLWLIPLVPLIGAAVNGLYGNRKGWSHHATSRVAVASSGLAMVAAFAAIVDWWSSVGAAAVHVNTMFTWIPAGFGHDRRRPARRPAGRLRLPHRLTVRHDAVLRDVRGVPDPRVLDRVHARREREGVRAVLRVPEPVHVRDAHAGSRGQPRRDVRRLGRRRAVLLPADRVLLREGLVRRRGQEGVHRQPHRRLRVHARHLPRCSRCSGPWTSPACSAVIAAEPAKVAAYATPIALLLFVGAVGKSAQLPLYVWLPDAMAGPTPVSALIHAATMVTAGVYMVARTNFLFRLSPTAMLVVAVVGGVDRGLRGDHRARAERHQEGPRVLDRLPARLHVPGGRRRGRSRRRSSTSSPTPSSRPACSSGAAR